MNVLVNGRFLGRRITGVERYGYEILRRLSSGLRVVQSEGWSAGLRGHLWEQFTLPGIVGANNILWSPANTGPVRVKNQVLTLHDLSPLEHPEWYQPSFAVWYRLIWPLLIKQVNQIVVSSNFVRSKLLSRFRSLEGQVTVIPGGVDIDKFHPGAGIRMGLPGSYVLFVGSVQPRKNITRLLEAWQQAQAAIPDTWLIIAGSNSSIFRRVDIPQSDRVIFLGHVSDADLPSLYSGADLFVMPSLDEGFGLPVLEAMASGAPVAASNAGALPEVISDAGWLFDPNDVQQISETMVQAITDPAAQRLYREKGLERAHHFSWQDSANKLWKVFKEWS